MRKTLATRHDGRRERSERFQHTDLRALPARSLRARRQVQVLARGRCCSGEEPPFPSLRSFRAIVGRKSSNTPSPADFSSRRRRNHSPSSSSPSISTQSAAANSNGAAPGAPADGEPPRAGATRKRVGLETRRKLKDWQHWGAGLVPDKGETVEGAPECRGHNAPCVRRVVQKQGAKAQGRTFYSCRFWQNREKNCGHFAWADSATGGTESTDEGAASPTKKMRHGTNDGEGDGERAAANTSPAPVAAEPGSSSGATSAQPPAAVSASSNRTAERREARARARARKEALLRDPAAS